jgi:hypothetical protein
MPSREDTEEPYATQADVGQRLTGLSLEDIRAISEPLDIDGTAGSQGHPGKHRVPAVRQRTDLFERLNRAESQFSNSSSSSGWSGKRKSAEDDEDGAGRVKYSKWIKANRRIKAEERAGREAEVRQEIIARERDLRVEDLQLELPGLINVGKLILPYKPLQIQVRIT